MGQGTLPSGASVTVQLWVNNRLVSAPFTTYGTGNGTLFGGGAGGSCDDFPINRGDQLAIGIVYTGIAPSTPIDLSVSLQYQL